MFTATLRTVLLGTVVLAVALGTLAAPAAADCTGDCLDTPGNDIPVVTPAPDFGTPVVDDVSVMPGDRVTPLTEDFKAFLKAKKAF